MRLAYQEEGLPAARRTDRLLVRFQLHDSLVLMLALVNPPPNLIKYLGRLIIPENFFTLQIDLR